MTESKPTYLPDNDGGLPLAFLDRFWGGARLEPRSRSEDAVQIGLEARIADPLWMLTRQWQMGEFKAEDNGSPIRVDIQYETEILDTVTGLTADKTPGGLPVMVGTPIPFAGVASDMAMPPLETIVEQEPITMDWRMRVQIGQQFERILRSTFAEAADQSIVNKLISTYRGPPPFFGIQLPERIEAIDYATQRFLRLMHGRAIDGGELRKAYASGQMPELPVGFEMYSNHLVTALSKLEHWYQALYNQPVDDQQSYWKPRELEYEFMLTGTDTTSAVDVVEREVGIRDTVPVGPATADDTEGTRPVNPSGPMRTQLAASDYRSGDLDWYSCDLRTPCPDRSGRDGKYSSQYPTRVDFAGKPNERWWAFEDGNVDLAKLDASKPNLARLLMIEFSLVYADDWFMVPLELPLGSLTRIKSLNVVDVFGVKEPINSAIESKQDERDSWALFTLSELDKTTENMSGAGLFLPPTLCDREESAPIEEIRFMRDEGANMVFAIEKTLQNGLGVPIDGSEAHRERMDRERKKIVEATQRELRTDSHSADTLPVYRLASAVPHHWIPYIPQKVPKHLQASWGVTEHAIRLRQAEMVRSEDADNTGPNSPMTSMLSDDRMHWLNEESVPRAGVKLQLTRQRVRWTDGKTYVWVGRKVVTGRGEGESGLRFDYLKNITV